MKEFNAARRELDPKNIMANDIINTLMPLSDSSPANAEAVQG